MVETTVTKELANRVILQDPIPAEGTLLIKTSTTGGKEYEPLTLGDGFVVTGDPGEKVIVSTGAGLTHQQIMSRIFLG
jgi:hypothetical protein